MAITHELPRWDLTPYFPSVTSVEFGEAKVGVDVAMGRCEALLEKGEGMHVSASPELASLLLDTILAINEAGDSAELIASYVSVTVAADSFDESALAAESAFQPFLIRFSKIMTRFTAWVGKLPIDELIRTEPKLAEYQYPLSKSQLSAKKLMSPAEENLAADLSETGSDAWSRLYDNFSSQIEVQVGDERMPMSRVRNLAYDPDSERRRLGYDAELHAWSKHDLPIAAAMNSIKGSANLLAKRRGWNSQLDVTLFNCNMDRASLDAMMSAAQDSFPTWRRYLRAKAKLLGHQGGLPWHDLFAPVGSDAAWDYEQAKSFVVEGFRAYSDKMADFALRNFEENWIDVGPRRGKRDGAFCAGMARDESRILMNFEPSFGSVATLAHELGHGYHNICLADRTNLQKATPMTLAETASIFCETIIKRRAIAQFEGGEKLAILEASLQGACQVVVDITSRYLFETTAIDGRKDRELSARELCEAMKAAQLATYGDGLDAERLHPYMWAAKPHYYSYSAFYNFPYMFGLLFALGLYAIYLREPEGFHDRYDRLLSETGLFDAAELASNFGIDIRQKAFWAGSLSILEDDILEFERLAADH